MKNLTILFSIITMISFMACGGSGSDNSLLGDAALTTEMDSMCYAVGASFSKSMKDSPIKLKGDQVCKGYLECKDGNSFVNEQNVKEITAQLQQEFRKIQAGTPADMNPDSLSYAVGSSYFLQVKSMGVEMNDKALAKGIDDNFKEEGGLLDQQQITSLLQRFGAIVKKARAEKDAVVGEKNKAEGAAFLAEKAQEEGVKATDSGLLYKVLKEGTGKSPIATDKVSVHYEGKLIDGTIFDSSIQRGQPTEFPLNQVIRGWTEGLQLMKTGAKYQFYIPSDLAYGPGGQGGDIGPNATLIFDVELLEIK